MNFLSKINHIPFKYVISMNVAVIINAATFVSTHSVGQTTENRSQAAETPLPTPISTITVDPQSPPTLLASEPDWAKIGDALLIRGQNLGTIPFGQLTLGDIVIPPQNIVEWTPDHIVITVPKGVSTNPLQIKYNDDKILQTNNAIRIVKVNESNL